MSTLLGKSRREGRSRSSEIPCFSGQLSPANPISRESLVGGQFQVVNSAVKGNSLRLDAFSQMVCDALHARGTLCMSELSPMYQIVSGVSSPPPI